MGAMGNILNVMEAVAQGNYEWCKRFWLQTAADIRIDTPEPKQEKR